MVGEVPPPSGVAELAAHVTVRVAVAAEAGERHREQADGPYGEGERIKIHTGA